MKNLILLSLLIPVTLFGAVEYDTKKGVDLTRTNVVTATLLNQLVDAGTIGATNKGAVIRRSGGGGTYWPDVTLNGRYTNFLWLDTYTTPATLKQYVCCGDVYTNWVASTVTPNSITAAEILNYTITEPKMATNSVNQYALQDSAVTANKIAGNSIIAGKIGPAAVILGNYAFGSIVGGNITNNTITSTNLADGAVTREKLGASVVDNTRLTNDAVFTANITNGAVTGAKIASATVTTNNLLGEINRGLLESTIRTNQVNAWALVGVNGTTPSLLKAFNIASVTRSAAGIYRLVYTSSMVDTNYTVIGNCLYNSGSESRTINYFSNTVSDVFIRVKGDGGGNDDVPFSIRIDGGF